MRASPTGRRTSCFGGFAQGRISLRNEVNCFHVLTIRAKAKRRQTFAGKLFLRANWPICTVPPRRRSLRTDMGTVARISAFTGAVPCDISSGEGWDKGRHESVVL